MQEVKREFEYLSGLLVRASISTGTKNQEVSMTDQSKPKKKRLCGSENGKIPLIRGRDSERRMLAGRRNRRRSGESNSTAILRIRRRYQKPEEEL